MDVNNRSTANYNSTSDVKSVFFCPQLPDFIWDLNDITFPRILTVLTLIASPVPVLLNTLAIVAMKKRRELQKLANILLCSMAVTDLLIGAITMPLSSTVDVLIRSQASFDHICTLDFLVNKPLIVTLSLSSLYHLTAIAWERYMAIQKWIDYRNKVTKSLLKKLGITAWLIAVLTEGPTVLIIVAGVERKVLKSWFMGECVVVVGCLVVIAYFYIMVFLGVRKRKQNQISQVTILMTAKLEYKVAKTTGLLTAGLISSFVPTVSIVMLGTFFPVFRMNSAFRLAETLVQFNSLLNPILYSYRDRRFRNAVLELLGMRKSPKPSQPVDAVRCFRRKDPFGSVELVTNNAKTFTSRLTRSASTGQAVKIGEALKISLKRCISYPTLNKFGDSSFGSNFKPQQTSSILITSALIHSESSNRCKPRDNKGEIHPAISPKRSATPTSTSLTRSKSWDDRTCVEVSDSCQNAQVRTIIRQNSVP